MEYDIRPDTLNILENLSSDGNGVDIGAGRKHTLAIDALVFRLPNHDFKSATSSVTVPFAEIGKIVPNQLMEYLDGDPNGLASNLRVYACSRFGKEVSVSMSMGKKKINFSINQIDGNPELTFEEQDQDFQWNKIGEANKLTWQEFETGLFVITSIIDAYDVTE